MQMPTGKGDMGTRSSEETLKKTSAGKTPSASYALGGHEPNMGGAMGHLKKQMMPAPSTMKDCY